MPLFHNFLPIAEQGYPRRLEAVTRIGGATVQQGFKQIALHKIAGQPIPFLEFLAEDVQSDMVYEAVPAFHDDRIRLPLADERKMVAVPPVSQISGRLPSDSGCNPRNPFGREG